MPIGTMTIHAYRKQMGKNASEHRSWKNFIQIAIARKVPSIDIREIDMYQLESEYQNFNAGQPNRRLIIFGNATFQGAGEYVEQEDGLVINGQDIGITKILPPLGEESNVVIKSEEGTPIAEYSPNKEELNILFDLFSEYNQQRIEIFEYIMEKFEELVWFPKTLENSWLHSQNKDALTQRFVNRMKRQVERQIVEDRERHNNIEASIQDRQRRLKREWDTLLRLRKSIQVNQEQADKTGEKLIKDLDLIVEHEKVKDLHIIDGVFHVYTEPLYIISSEDKRYYLGKMKFTMNLENTDVRFHNLENERRGYWTDNDPHPHVNGAGGSACLGNVSATIAELSSRGEAYALALICIDFLENANVDDPAGAKVRNWDEVDEEGTIIVEGGQDEDTFVCDNCSERYHNDERMVVYNNADPEDGIMDERNVCDACCSEDYHHSDFYEEYVLNDIEEPGEEE